MTKTDIVFTHFGNPEVNRIAANIISRSNVAIEKYKQAEKNLYTAILNRFENGKDFVDNEEIILDECQTQRAFAETIGITENMLSNDIRAYRALEIEGVTHVDDVIPYLQQKKIRPVTSSWEKLPRLLSDPYGETKDQRPRDEKMLENMQKQIMDIVSRNESINHNELVTEAIHTGRMIDDAKQHLSKLDPLSYDWRSEGYKAWCRNLGICMITKKPCHPEFHHTNLTGGSGGMGEKLPDVFGFPVDPIVHSKIENGQYKITREEIADALVTTLTLFIMTHYE